MTTAMAAASPLSKAPDEHHSDDLKGKTVRGAVASGAAQAAGVVLRTASMVVMARLLYPRDFGLFGMVLAFTGFLSLFRDFGLSMASVTRITITNDQLSTLFWLNVCVGAVLAVICAGAAPLLAAFYGEPRLVAITIAIGAGFIFIGAGAQHRALLQRAMRFGVLATIDTLALLVGIATGVTMAALGKGYWALVFMTICPQIAATLGVWMASRWLPGRPRRGVGVKSLVWYGGSVTFNGVIVYVAYNLDKILLGRFWGAEALGVYGRAYQLINLPLDSLTSTVSQVAFPALARLQNDPARLRRYYLEGYSLFFALILPLTAGCVLFPETIVLVALGAKWLEAASIFRLLAPTMFVFALVNPCAWLLMSTGRITRSVQMAFVIAPTVVLGYTLGLPYGPQGVASGFSVAMLILAGPLIIWAVHRTPITLRDVVGALSPSLISIGTAAAAVLVFDRYITPLERPFLRLIAQSSVLFGVYWTMLLGVLNQRSAYVTLFRQLSLRRIRSSPPPQAAAL